MFCWFLAYKFCFSPYQFWVDQTQFLGSDSSARVRSFALCNFGHKVKEKKYIQPNTLYKQPSVLCCREPKEYSHWFLDFIEEKQPTESWSDTYYHCSLGNLHFSGRSEMKRVLYSCRAFLVVRHASPPSISHDFCGCVCTEMVSGLQMTTKCCFASSKFPFQDLSVNVDRPRCASFFRQDKALSLKFSIQAVNVIKVFLVFLNLFNILIKEIRFCKAQSRSEITGKSVFASLC